MEVLDRDCSHPSIIGWCPFNETQADQDDEVIRIVYKITKKLDPTRPVIDTSGWRHVESDMMCVHDYDQDPKSFAARYQAGNTNFVSEYGGIWWNTDPDTGWGYGKRPADICEFYERYEGLTDALLKNPDICAFCYTQLYDVEQECNGLYTYDRKPKFDAGRIKEINTRRASVECR